MLIVGGAVAVILSIMMAFAIARSIVNPLRQVLRATEDLRAGDGDRLSVAADETPSSATSRLAQRLHRQAPWNHLDDQVVVRVHVERRAADRARGNDDLNQRTQEQAARAGRNSVEHGRDDGDGETERR